MSIVKYLSTSIQSAFDLSNITLNITNESLNIFVTYLIGFLSICKSRSTIRIHKLILSYIKYNRFYRLYRAVRVLFWSDITF